MIRLPLGPDDASLLLFFNKPAITDRMKSRTSKRGEICTATWGLHAGQLSSVHSLKTVANTISFLELLAGIGLEICLADRHLPCLDCISRSKKVEHSRSSSSLAGCSVSPFQWTQFLKFLSFETFFFFETFFEL